uniref:Guanylate cyclase activator 2B n=1 Tax=Amphiprion percula TaxID=161767 RepID=A0A3P8TXP1_AMPPE
KHALAVCSKSSFVKCPLWWGLSGINTWVQTLPTGAVKQLKKLFNLDEKIPELTKKDVEDVCANRDLPQVFKSVCQEEGRQAVFSTLVRIPLDVCEICSFAACTGC